MIGVRGTKLTVKFWNKTEVKPYLSTFKVHYNSERWLQLPCPRSKCLEMSLWLMENYDGISFAVLDVLYTKHSQTII